MLPDLRDQTSSQSAEDRPRLWLWLSGAVAFIALVVVAILVWPSQNPSVDLGFDEFQSAVASATGVLNDAPGFTGTQLGYADSYLAAAVWFTARQDGQAAIVQRVDGDVRDSGWWISETAPSATGETVDTTVWLSTDEHLLIAQDSDAWSVTGQEPEAVNSLSIGLLMIRDSDQLLDTRADDAEVTRQETADGGARLILTADFEDGTAVQEWEIHPDGWLQSYSWELVDVSRSATERDPVNSGTVEYLVLEDPPALPDPTPGTGVSFSALRVPDDLPLSR